MILSTMKFFMNFIRKFFRKPSKQQHIVQLDDIDIMAPFEKPPAYYYDWIQYSGKN